MTFITHRPIIIIFFGFSTAYLFVHWNCFFFALFVRRIEIKGFVKQSQTFIFVAADQNIDAA